MGDDRLLWELDDCIESIFWRYHVHVKQFGQVPNVHSHIFQLESWAGSENL